MCKRSPLTPQEPIAMPDPTHFEKLENIRKKSGIVEMAE